MLHSLAYRGITALFVLCLFLQSVYRQLFLRQWTLTIAQACSCVPFLIIWSNSSWANRFTTMVSVTFYNFLTLKFTYLVWTFLLTSRSVYLLHSCYLLLYIPQARQMQSDRNWMKSLLSLLVFSISGNGDIIHLVTEVRCSQGDYIWFLPHPHLLQSVTTPEI